jgi:hypothetical protein
MAAAAVGVMVVGAASAAAQEPQPVPRFRPDASRQHVVHQRERATALLSAAGGSGDASTGGKGDGRRAAWLRDRRLSTAGGGTLGAAQVVPPLVRQTAGASGLTRSADVSARVGPRLWSVLGEVLDFGGAAVAGADVSMDVYGSSDLVWSGSAESDAAGGFAFSDSPQGSANIFVGLPPGRGATGYQAWGVPLTDGSQWFVGFHPGLVPFSTTRTSMDGWDDWSTADVQTYGTQGGADTDLGSRGMAHVMPPDYGYACVYYDYYQGVEWNQDSPYVYPVSSGGWGGTPISVDQDDAQSVLVLSRWASGKPGTRIRLGLGGWPYGYVADVYGYSEDPRDDRLQDYSDFTSPGGSWGYSFSLRIPKTVKPGYAYVIKAARADQDSGLVVRDYFQVCSLRSSRATVRRGAAVRLSGVVPTQGHWGSQAGYRKTVTVYARTRAAGQPSTWKPGKGWKKVCTCKANGYGTYRSRKLRPRRTTWYVVRYPGDQWYWGAYTSVIKVRVR